MFQLGGILSLKKWVVILKSILYRIKYPGVLGQNNYNQVRLTHCWWEGYNFGRTLLDISIIHDGTMMTMMRRMTYPTLAGFQHHWAAGQPTLTVSWESESGKSQPSAVPASSGALVKNSPARPSLVSYRGSESWRGGGGGGGGGDMRY